jgi:hypothetical protein
MNSMKRSLEELTVHQLVEKFVEFKELEESLSCQIQPTTGTCLELDESKPHLRIITSTNYYFLLFVFSNINLENTSQFLSSLLHATSIPTSIISLFLYLFEKRKLQNPSLYPNFIFFLPSCHFLPPKSKYYPALKHPQP